ncbi:hypothetical protein BD779DRAFT_743526 [Infundibulicybe gibba]|nr:hypothetical protein BD779DRAFT_743526 [Infundibulicybe gibba]
MRSKQPCFSERPLSSTWSYVLTERVDLVSTNFANSLGFAEPIKTDVSLNPGLDTNVKFLGDVFVRDPPRSYLPIPTYPSLDHSRTDFEGGRALCADTRILKSHPLSEPPINPTTNDEIAMPGKRRSLQSILVPSFLHLPPTQALQDMEQPITSRTRSHSSAEQSLYYHESTPSSSELASTFTSPRSSPPPDFLLDDDPFANLSGSTLRTAPDTVTVATP